MIHTGYKFTLMFSRFSLKGNSRALLSFIYEHVYFISSLHDSFAVYMNKFVVYMFSFVVFMISFAVYMI